MKKKMILLGRNFSKILYKDLTNEFDLILATDAYQALNLLENNDVKVIFLQLHLPSMSGLEFLQKVKENKKYSDIVIIVMGDCEHPAEEFLALSVGADDYFKENISAEVLNGCIKRILSNKELLKHSNSKYNFHRNLLDTTNTGIYVMDAVNHNLLYANQAAEAFLENKQETCYGKKCYEYFFERKSPCENCLISLAQGHDSQKEMYFDDKIASVSVHMLEWLSRPAYAIYMKDITEDKKAKEIAQQRFQDEVKRRYRVDLDFMAYLVVNVSTGLVVEHDPHGFPVPTIFPGHPVSEFIERVLPTVIDYDKRQQFAAMLDLQNLKNAFANGQTILTIDYRRYSRSIQDIMWARSTIQLMEDPGTKDLMFFLYTYDINENKMLQEVIEKAINYDYSFIAYLNVFSKNLKLYMTNDNTINSLSKNETSYEKAVHDYVEKLVPLKAKKDALQKMSLDSICKHLEQNGVYEFDLTIKKNDDSVGIMRMRYVFYDQAYGIVLWVSKDITDVLQNALERQNALQQQLDELKEFNHEKSYYLSTVSARMRNPIKNVITDLKKIGNMLDTNEKEQQIKLIKSELEAVTETLNDIIDISNLELQKLKASESQFSINYLVKTVIRDITIKYKKVQPTIQLDVNVSHDSCLGDYNGIYKILYNILDNAVRYSSAEIKILFNVFELPFLDYEKTNYRFVIKDLGKGMNEDLLKNAFRPFYSYRNNKKENISSGLGLPVAKLIAEKIGGDISLMSEIDKGTTVVIDLPLAIANISLEKKQNSIFTKVENCKGNSVLFVTDKPLELLAIRKILESKYYKVGNMPILTYQKILGVDAIEADYILFDLDAANYNEILEVLVKMEMQEGEKAHVGVYGKSIPFEQRKKFLDNGIDVVYEKPLRFSSLIKFIQ